MPKPSKGPRLGAGPAHERKILANLAKSLIEHRSIRTTEAKARRLQPYIEKLITKAKKGDIHNRRMVARKLSTQVDKYTRGFDAVYTLFDEVVPDLDPNRQGGYTRIVKLPAPDNAPMAEISLVTEKVESKAKVQPTKEEAAKPASDEEAKEADKAEETAEEAVETSDSGEETAEAEKAEDADEAADSKE